MMKKALIAVSMAAASSFAFAGDVTFDATNKVASQNLANADCGVISSTETAKVRGSKEVRISYNCNASNAGVGTAHPQGKGYAFGVSSGGGAILREGAGTGFANEGAAQTAAGDAATNAFNRANSTT